MDKPVIEIERYELAGEPRYHFQLDRRDFFRTLGAGLLVIGVVDSLQAQGRPPLPQELSAWLHIGSDGAVTAFTGKAEVGQNTRTALVQAVAEELRVQPSAVKLVMADTDQVPFDMGTFGSRSMPDMLPQLRKVAATARELLDRAGSGAARANVLKTAVVSGTGLTPAPEWKVLGTSLQKVDGRAFVSGQHRYASDMKLPGMLVGAIVRPPSFGAKLDTLEDEAAKKIPGVTVVRDGDFLGIAAPDRRKAQAAVAALKTEWTAPPQVSQAGLFAHLKKTAEPRTGSTRGSLEEGLAAADQKLSAEYTLGYIAHAPLEPRAAVAQWQDGKLTVWTGSQRPFGVRKELADAFSIPESKVRVIIPDTGSGYGGKHTGDAAVEAARLAKAAGRPVKLVWTREEEFIWAYFRPAGVMEVRSGFKRDGTLTAWEFHNYNSGGSGIATMYDVPHQMVHFHPSQSPLRQGSYRALAATANHFAREVHMDEIAAALKMDPLELRLKNLKDARLRAVFERAAEAFGWGKKQTGAGVGMGGGFEKGGYTATFCQVSAGPGLRKVRVERIVTAFECGAAVNPDCLRNQIEGAIVMGLGGALTEEVRFAEGRIVNPRFSAYQVPRFRDMPLIETIVIDRKDLPPAGAGETPIVGVAPAISNAVFAVTGKRLRSLPLLGAAAAV